MVPLVQTFPPIVPLAAEKRSGFSGKIPNGTIGKISNGTIGRNTNARYRDETTIYVINVSALLAGCRVIFDR